jgi:vacuolar protein sorting-associated protein VTA1
MSATLPPTLKSLKRFFKRAEELDRAAASGATKPAVIAYFCRSYALQLGLKLHQNLSGDEAKVAMDYLLSIMTDVEAAKAKLPKYDGDKAKEFCTQFALSVFKRADDEDRAGMADKNTARTFYAASTFLDMLLQFGPLDESIKQLPLYAKFKSNDIVKALKEGRTPTPGPPGGDANDSGLVGGGGEGESTQNTNATTQPPVTPSVPASTPTLPQQPTVQPTKPTVQPTQPTVQPTQPTVQPSSTNNTASQKQETGDNNIALDMAIEMVKEAIKQDHAGNYPQAFRLYKECLGFFMDAIKCSKNPEAKKTIMARMDAYMKRAEVLKKSGKV